ncbi:cytochrome c3 family protein [Trichloromonas acetexigens]|uniref:Cytochrome C n=1 Tax=Trichloromonas acetexigens TaxID=38815 RepID=A0A550JAX9_9BACT|nr:cytochrome c3 family protein [Desulfuromonas acetexigens]TRO80283.1 cytochrome C [Desulfuromonas acetexigens]
MKKLLVVAMLAAFAAAPAFAADVYTYEGKGVVTFDHKGHADKLGCEACHQGEPAKIEVTKDSAHKDVCKNCHTEKGGPTKCNDCHVKK